MGQPRESRRRYKPGDQIAYLTVIEYVYLSKWRCLCVCGEETTASTAVLSSGGKKSCGCKRHEPEQWAASKVASTTHGHSSPPSPTYRSWIAMRKRCEHSAHKNYHRYGGRGIKVCKRWTKFENFLADMGERPEGMTLSRKSHKGNYTPKNCEWAPNGKH